MSPTRKAKPAPPPDRDRLARQSAGAYRTEDGRFEVRQSDTSWYLVDLERTNDFGQELIHGPFGTLKEVRDAIPGARKVTPLARPKVAAGRAPTKAKAPPPPPKSWIDLLPQAEAKEVRRLIRAVEGGGFADAEDVVRATRRAGSTTLAAHLIERRLQTIVDGAEPAERRRARELVRRVLGVLIDEGALTAPPLPGWALVETEAGVAPPKRLRPKV